MPFTSGAHVGSDEIVGPIGARLYRDVAIDVRLMTNESSELQRLMALPTQ